MKTRILDISDCSENLLLGSSKHRHSGQRRYQTIRHTALYSDFRHRSTPLPIEKLTEHYFSGVNPGNQLDYQLDARLAQAEPANISYQARCAERWWTEFCRWFGTQD